MYKNLMKNYEDRNSDIEFIGVLQMTTENGMPKFHFVEMQAIEVGKPAYLMLKDGRIAKTTPVLEWSIYGSMRIETKNHLYYANELVSVGY